jgi:hypothetical protein
MNDDVVTGADHTVTVDIPGTDRSYPLRAPTFGEVGQMAARAEGAMVPSDTIFAEVIREAVEGSDLPQSDKDRHCQALDAFFEADDALRSLYASLPEAKDWSAEHRREVSEAVKALRVATRGRDRAEWAVREVPAVREARRHQGEVGRAEQTDMVALCLGWDADKVRAMPAGDFILVQQRAMALIRPTQAAEKN